MTPDQARGISVARLCGWADLLAREVATPFLVIGYTHGGGEGEPEIGHPVVVTLEDATYEGILSTLEQVIETIRSGLARDLREGVIE